MSSGWATGCQERAEQRGPAATEEAAVGVVDEANRAIRGESADDIRVGVDHGAVGRRLALTLGGLGDIDAIDEDPGRAPRAAGQRAQRQIEARRSAAGDVQVELGAYGLASARAGDRVRHEAPAAGRPPWAVPQLLPTRSPGDPANARAVRLTHTITPSWVSTAMNDGTASSTTATSSPSNRAGAAVNLHLDR
jgi:hypothetical protein